MKRSRIISAALLLTMLFSLCACGADSTPPATAVPTSTQPAATAAPAHTPTERPMVTGYIATELTTPDWVKTWGSCDIANDTFYICTETADGGVAVTAFDTLSESFRRYDIDTAGLHNAHSLYISAADNSVWAFVYEARTLEEISNNSNVGEMREFIAHIDLETGEHTLNEISFWEESFNMPMYLIAMDDERALFGNSSVTEIEGVKGYNNFVIDKNANVIARPEVDILGVAKRVRVDGTLYLPTAQGLAPLDTETLQCGAAIGAIINQPVLYSSSCGNFLVTKDNALFAIDPTSGAETEMFKWADVALSFSRLYGQNGLENKNGDIYHLTDRITKITTGQIPLKDTLTLACFGDTNSYGYSANGGFFGSSDKSYVCSDSLLDAIIRFNNSDPDYKIEIKPHIYSSDEERTRLLIDLATSGGADILDTSLLPDGAWRFVKTFMSGSEDVNLSSGIPAQKAVLERAVENALAKEQGESMQPEQFNGRDAEFIRALAYNTDKCVSDSDAVIDTIRTILTAYIGGQYTASDAAKQLQSRMSICLAEQYK